MAEAARKRIEKANRKSASSVPTKLHLSTPQVFGHGEELKIARKSRVVDKARAHENLAPEDRVPIDVDVTGATGRVCGAAYTSSTKKGKVCVPIELADGNIVGVPVDRLERVSRTPAKESSDVAMQRGPSGVSKETMDFWRTYFRDEEEKKRLTEENERLRQENEKLKSGRK